MNLAFAGAAGLALTCLLLVNPSGLKLVQLASESATIDMIRKLNFKKTGLNSIGGQDKNRAKIKPDFRKKPDSVTKLPDKTQPTNK